MVYKIVKLSDVLYYIYWAQDASAKDGYQFVSELEQLLMNADHKLCFISDLRYGCITQVDVLRKLSQLSTHPNWGAGTSFVSPASSIFSRFFDRLLRMRHREDPAWTTPDQAITYLEMIFPGVTKNIDWDKVIAGSHPEVNA